MDLKLNKNNDKYEYEFESEIFSLPPDYRYLKKILEPALGSDEAENLSHRLILKYRTLANVFDAGLEGLKDVKGMTDEGISALLSALAFIKLYEFQKGVFEPDFKSLDEVGKFLQTRYLGIKIERASVLLLDDGGNFIDFKFISDGDMKKVGVSAKRILGIINKAQATSFIFCHNHPNNVPLPSAQDVALTEMLADIMSYTDIAFLDHIIVSDNDFISMRLSREYSHLFKK